MINYPSILGAPPIQSSDIVISQVSDTQFLITVGNIGNGVDVLIVVKLSTSALTRPIFNNTYTANSVFESGSDLGQGNYVVGNGSSVLVTGLSASTTYNIYAYAFNKKGNGTEKYNISTATNNPVTQATLAPQVAPTVQTTNLIWLGDRRLRTTRGNGTFIIAVYKSGGAVSSNPVDNTTYTVGQDLGSGNIVGYIGTDSDFDIDNLTYGVSYGMRCYEFNVGSGNPKYNTNTATGNPITANMPTVVTYYHYLNKPQALITHRSPYNMLSLGARDGSQKYTTCVYEGTTETHAFMVTEGDGSRLTGIDRTTRARKLIADSPITPTNWYEDTPLDSYGDSPAFLDSSCLQYNLYSPSTTYSIGDRVRTGTSNQQVWSSLTNGNIGNTPISSPSNWQEVVMWDGNQCWAMWAINFTYLGTPYQIMIYPANRFIAARYGVGMAVSTDEFETITRFSSPIIAESANFAAYYCKGTPEKLSDGYWYMFVQNYVPSLLVEGHLYCVQLWRTSQDPNPVAGTWGGWTNYSGTVDIFSSRNFGGAVDVSTPWIIGTKLHFYLSPNTSGVTGAFNAAGEGLTQILSTFPVGNKIVECSCEIADLGNFRTKFVVERLIYTSPRLAEIELRTFCQRLVRGIDIDIACMSFLHAYQTRLSGISQNEPKNDSSFLSTELDLTGGVLVGTEVYPDWIKFGMPHQSNVNDTLGGVPSPRNIIAQTNGTVVGSPRIGRANSIQAVNNGFVTFPNSEFVYDANYLAFKITMGENSLNTVYGIAGMDTDVVGGQHGWHIRKAGLNIAEVWVYGSNNVSYKRYRVTISSNKSGSDSALMNWIGFEFKNGVLKVRVDWNLDCTVTKLQDDSFTTLNVTDEPLRIGAIYPTTNDEMYSQDIVGSFIMLSGVNNVTDDHYLYNNLIGY